MNKKNNQRIFGMTRTELLILTTMGGFMCCILILFGGYVIYLNRMPSVAAIPPTSTLPQPPQYSPQFTNSPLPSEIPIITTLQPSLNSTHKPHIGTFSDPVPIGVGFRFPGFGILTVISSSWLPGQTGFAIVELSFICERPAGQECDTGDFMLDALGGSGNGYNREYDAAIPEPDFGSFMHPPIYGGGVENGYAGFLITNNESTLLMRTRLFLQEGEFFFKISP